MFNFIKSTINDTASSDDSFQYTFIKVIRTLKNGLYNEEGNFLPWIMRIAHNLVIDHFRKSNRIPTIKNNDEFDVFQFISDGTLNAEDILVRVNGDEEYKAKIIGKDPLSDIAVLQIEADEKFIPVKFGNSDKSRIGDWVIAIGNPFGLGGTVTSGIISARNRSIGLARYEDFIQTDASINQGNSGGPLFNMNGDVIGINTAILGQSGSIGIGFAIPSNSAVKVINQLIEFGETKRGWLGVRIQEVTKEIADLEELDKPRGALIVSVADGSPSDKGGILAGDIIVGCDDNLINEMKEEWVL